MAFGEFGVSGALAYKHDWNATMQRDHQLEELDRRTRIDAETQAKLQADQYKFGSVTDNYNRTRIQDFNNKNVEELGQYIASNPDYKNNVSKLRVYNEIMGRFTNNNIVLESARVATEKKNLEDYLAKNPGMSEHPEIKKQLAEYKRYSEIGNASEDPSVRKEFVFRNPENGFKPEEIAKQIMPALTSIAGQNAETGEGWSKTYLDKNKALSVAATELNPNNDRAFLWNGHFNTLSEGDKGRFQKKDGTYDVKSWLAEYMQNFAHTSSSQTILPKSKRNNAGNGTGGTLPDYIGTVAKEQVKGIPFSDQIIYNNFPKEGAGPITDGVYLPSKTDPKSGEILETKRAEDLYGLHAEWKTTGRQINTSTGLAEEVVWKVPTQKLGELKFGVTDNNPGFDWFGFGKLNYELDKSLKYLTPIPDKDGGDSGFTAITGYRPIGASVGTRASTNKDAYGQKEANGVFSQNQQIERLNKLQEFKAQAKQAGHLFPNQNVGIDPVNWIITDYTTGDREKMTPAQIADFQSKRK